MKIFYKMKEFQINDEEPIGAGNEGFVYLLKDDNSTFAIKIFNSKEIASKKQSKIFTLISKFSSHNNQIKNQRAYPIEPIFDSNKMFIGYSMNYFLDYQPIFKFFYNKLLNFILSCVWMIFNKFKSRIFNIV